MSEYIPSDQTYAYATEICSSMLKLKDQYKVSNDQALKAIELAIEAQKLDQKQHFLANFADIARCIDELFNEYIVKVLNRKDEY